MKTLLLLRHAKSSWSQSNLADHDRSLKQRGRDDARKMGRWLEEKDLVPDHVITSTAKRARLTAELVMDACGYLGSIEHSRKLYIAGPEDIAEVIATVDDAVNTLMVVGHNPGMEELVFELSGKLHSIPTCAVAEFHLPVPTWRDIVLDGGAVLANLWVPRQF